MIQIKMSIDEYLDFLTVLLYTFICIIFYGFIRITKLIV